MAKPWSTVVADPQFEALTTLEKAATQRAYFEDVLLPQLKPEEIDATRSAFFSDFDFGNNQGLGQGLANSAGQGFAKGLSATFLSGPGAVLEAVGLEENDLLKAGKATDKQIEEAMPVSLENQGKFVVKAAGAIGQAGSMIVVYPFSGASTGFKAASMAGKARQIALLGGFQGAAAGEEEATRLEINDPLTKALVIAGFGSAEFVSEKLGGYGVESSLTKLIGGEAVDATAGALRRGVTQGAVEGFEEVGAGVPQRAISRAVAIEDPTKPGYTFEGQPIPSPWDAGHMVEEFALGSIAGGSITIATEVLNKLPPAQQRDARNVAGLPPALRKAAYEELQQVNVEEDGALSVARGVDENTAANVRVAMDGRRANVLKLSAEVAAKEYEEGWKDRESANLVQRTPAGLTIFDNGQWFQETAKDEEGNAVLEPLTETSALDNERQEWIQTGKPPEAWEQPEAPTALEGQPIEERDPKAPAMGGELQTPAGPSLEGESVIFVPQAPLRGLQDEKFIPSETGGMYRIWSPAPGRRAVENIPAAPQPAKPSLAERFPDAPQAAEVMEAKQLSTAQKGRALTMWTERKTTADVAEEMGISINAAVELKRILSVPEDTMRTPQGEVIENPDFTDWVSKLTASDRTRTMPGHPVEGTSDILDFLNENRIYLPPKAQRGGEVDFLANDDRVSRYFRQFITTRDSASSTADVIADRAVDAGLLPTGSTANELAEAIEQAITARKSTRAQLKREGARERQAESQTTAFYRDTADGPVRIDPAELVNGDVLIVEGTPLKVTNVESDEDGYVTSVTLQDGKKYGIQTVSGDYVFLVDEFRPSQRRPAAEVGEFLPAGTEPEAAFQTQAPPPTAQVEAQTDTLDPYLADLGRSPTTTAGNIATELSEYTEEERNALQKVLKAPDNKPRTLAKALKAFQPRTGGRTALGYGSEMGERRDAVDAQLDRDEGIVRARRRSMRAKNPLAYGVTARAAAAAKAAVKSLLPSAEDAWFGTAQELRDVPRFRKDFVQNARLRDPSLTFEEAEEKFLTFVDNLPGSQIEGFTVGGRPYVIIGEVGVTEEDATPERAVRRVLIHEDAHEAVEAAIASSPELKAEWEGIKNGIAAEDLDALATDRYPWLSGWRTNTQLHDDLAHEWMAEQAEILEKRGEPATGLLQRFFEFIRKILSNLFSQEEADVTDTQIMNFIEAGRAARSREVRLANPLRPSMQTIVPPMDTPQAPMPEERVAWELAPGDEVSWNGPDRPASVVSGNTDATGSQQLVKFNDGTQAAVDAGQGVVRFSTQPTNKTWSAERKAQYDEFHANPDIPDSLKAMTEFLGSPTHTRRVRQALAPMVEMARAKLGSYQGNDVEVNPENTELVKEYAELAFTRDNTFAREYSQEFRDSWSPRVNGKPIHEGAVAAGVLQLEILDYATRLAATGDHSLVQELLPYANDIIIGDYFTMSNAGRALNARSMAGRDTGFWTAIKLLQQGQYDAAMDALGMTRENLEALRASIWSDEVETEVADGLADDSTAPGAQQHVQPVTPTNDYLNEGYMERASRVLSEEERNAFVQFDKVMRRIDQLQQLKENMEVRAANIARPSMQEDAQAYNSPEQIQAEIDKLTAEAKELLKKFTKSKTSSVSKEKRKKVLDANPKAKKVLSADAQAKKMLDDLENKPKRTPKDPPAWKQTYLDQIKAPKSEEDFAAEMTKQGVSAEAADKLYAQAQKDEIDRRNKRDQKARERKSQKGAATVEAFSAWVGGAEQDGIADFDALIAAHVTPAGFNVDAFKAALASKFQSVDPALIDDAAERVEELLAEKEAPEATTPQEFDARAKNLVANAIAKASDKTKALADPMTEAIKARMKGTITSDELRRTLIALGVEAETSFAVMRKVEQDIAARAAKRAATALRNQASAPTKTAEQIIDTLDKQQTEWVKPENLNAVRELAKKARKDAARGLRREWFNEYQKQFEGLGVTPTAAQVLTSRLWAENQKDRVNATLRRRESAQSSTAFINSIVREIFAATLQQQESPAWRLKTMTKAFQDRGLTEDQAKSAATWFSYRFDERLKEAQAKAAQKAGRALDVQKPTLTKIIAAVRTRALDPLNGDPVLAALAQAAGFNPLTTAQFTELAQLDQVMQTEGPTLRSKAASSMLKIMLSAKPPKKWADIITQMWINSALSSISTASLSAIHAVFIPARKIVFDFAGIAIDVLAKKTKPADAAGMYANMLGNMVSAFDNFVNTARYAGWNDAYRQRLVEFIHQMHSMQAEFQQSAATLRSSSSTAAEKGAAAAKLIFSSTDYMRRILSTADEVWGGVLQEYVIRNESMRVLVQKGGLSAHQAAIALTAANNAGEKALNDHMTKTGDGVEAALVARDAVQSAMMQIVAKYTDLDTATEVKRTAELEATMELGNRGPEEAPMWDMVNFGMEGFKKIAWAVRDRNELVGRMLTGFVTVPANILNRSAYFTPVGIARALYKMGKLGGSKQDIADAYEETMATEGQQRMRLIEGIVGTLAFTLLIAFTAGDDDEEGLNITGAGPKSKDLADAWKKLGHKPNHLEWVRKNGTVAFSIPWTRGGLDHLSLPFTMVGTLNDMKLAGLKEQPLNVDWGTQYAKSALMGLANQARFFGMKNLVSMPSQTSEKSLASNAAYYAAPFFPWAGFLKSVGRAVNPQADQSSVRSAVMAQLPFFNAFASEPALNALGDPKGLDATNFATTVSDRAEMTGFPMFIGIDPRSKDNEVYRFFLQEGVSPNSPNRATLESKNGFLPDATWQKYVKTRGTRIKAETYRQLPRLRLMQGDDLQNAIERISGDATTSTKKLLKLK